MPVTELTDRAVLSVTGEDAASFLAGLVTCAVEEAGAARYGALLTPQGKIIADFFLLPHPDGTRGFLLDAPRSVADVLLKRLTIYKLRAKIGLADLSAKMRVFAAWGAALPAMPEAAAFMDSRFSEMGQRFIAPPSTFDGLADASAAEYDTHRIRLAIPQGGRDFVYGDAFPHEACLDELGGVDFKKGCYVGQEVVSRTEHRGSARTRVAALSFAGTVPAEGAEIRAADKAIGRVGSVDAVRGRAIALLRLDRLADALAARQPLLAGEAVLRAERPVWASYAFPEATAVGGR